MRPGERNREKRQSQRHLRPIPPSGSNHQNSCFPKPAKFCYSVSFFFFFFAFFVFMPYIRLPDRRKRLQYFSFPFFRFGYEMLLQLSFFFFFWLLNGFRFDLFFVLGFRVFRHTIESPIKDKEKRIEIETNHPPSIQSDHRNHRHTKIHLDLLSSL